MAGVTAAATAAGSSPSVSGAMSANTGVAPAFATAAAVPGCVNDGTTASSPGPSSASVTASSSAALHEAVRTTSGEPSRSRKRSVQSAANRPPPATEPLAAACATYSPARPV